MPRTTAKKPPRRRSCRAEGAAGGQPRQHRVTVRVSTDERRRYLARARAEAPPGCKRRASLSGYMRDAAEARARGEAAPAAPSAEGFVGERCGVLRTTTGQEGACYEVRSAAALITSHSPETWEPDARYPRAVQERDYRGDPNERLKVERIAGAPQPDLVLNNTPTAVDGPPVVSGAGVVLGGNGRTMGLRLAYKRGTADEYRRQLLQRAPLFGLAAAAVESVPDPILVRVVPGLDGAGQAELAAASSRYNEGLTNALDERARAVSLSRRLTPHTLEALGDLLDKWETLRAAMAEAGPRFVERLTHDGIITNQNRAAMVDQVGGLTEQGKLTVEGAFLGLVVGTSDRLKQAAPSTLQKLERLVPFLARVHAQQNGHSLVPLVQEAMDLRYQAAVAQRPVATYAAQGGLFDEPAPEGGAPAGRAPDVVRLAVLLEKLTPKKLAGAARKWAAAADFNPLQPSFFAHPEPEATRAAFFKEAEEG